MRHFEYGRGHYANDCAINPAFAVGAAGSECKQATAPASATEKRAGQTSGAIFPLGGAALQSSLSISFDFICSIELFTLSSESVSLPYLFSNLWALVQTLADLYFKCLFHSERISLQCGPVALHYLISKVFFFFFAFYTCGDLWPFRRANYWSRVMMFLFLLKIRVTPSKDTDNIHREEVTWAINISSRISTAVIPLRLHLLHNRADTSQLGVAHRLLLDYAFQ